MPQNISNIANLDDSVSIAQFLERPVRLDQFKLVKGSEGDIAKPIQPVVFTDSNPQPVVRQYQLPGDVLQIGGKMQKIMNHQFLRADVRIKLVINANPFVAGRFYLTYSPYEEQVVNARKQRFATRAGLTAYPGVEIDIQIDNTVEICVPYASYKEAYVLTDPENYVTLSLYALTPILAGEENAGIVEFTFYAWFENIVINVPTAKVIPNMVTQQNLYVEKENREFKLINALNDLKRTNPQYYKYIKGIFKSKNVEIQIQKEAPKGSGPIGTIATTIRDVADQVKRIPIVGEIASTVSWVSDVVGNIANIFGWTKPTMSDYSQPLVNIPGLGYTNAEGVDNSVNLSLIGAKNELAKIDNVFPSGLDEMDLQYVCANPALKDVITWKAGIAGQSVGDVLTVIPVGIGPFSMIADSKAITCTGHEHFTGTWDTDLPKGYYTMQYDTTTHLLDTAPCEYVSQLFTYWRATMVYKISVVKTAFHSGRLEISFDPGMWLYQKDKPWLPDLAQYKTLDTTNNYKYILDITNDTEVTIKIPFVSERLFKSTQASNSPVFNSPSNDDYNPTFRQLNDSMIGSLMIRPVNDLLAPPNVAQDIRILIWKWAEDVVFGVPKQSIQSGLHIFTPFTKDNTPCNDIELENVGDDNIWEDQTQDKKKYIAAIKSVKVCASMQINIANKANGNEQTFFQDSSMNVDNMDSCKLALGERIVNLRVMLRCFRDIFPSFSNFSQDGDSFTTSFNFQEEYKDKDGFIVDYLNYMSYMYRFFRGGYRFKIYPRFKSNVHSIQSSITTNDIINDDYSGPTHVTFPSINPFHEVTIPYYSEYRRLPISIINDVPIINFTLNGENKPICRILRASNDDFTFGWLMGTPSLYQGVVVKNKCYNFKAASQQVHMQIDIPDSYNSLQPIMNCLSKQYKIKEQHDEFKVICIALNFFLRKTPVPIYDARTALNMAIKLTSLSFLQINEIMEILVEYIANNRDKEDQLREIYENVQEEFTSIRSNVEWLEFIRIRIGMDELPIDDILRIMDFIMMFMDTTTIYIDTVIELLIKFIDNNEN